MGPSRRPSLVHSCALGLLLLPLLATPILSQSSSFSFSPFTQRYGHVSGLFHADRFNAIIGGAQPGVISSSSSTSPPALFPIIMATASDDGSLDVSSPNLTDYYASSADPSNVPLIVGAASMSYQGRTLVYGGTTLPAQSSHSISYLTTHGWEEGSPSVEVISRSEHTITPIPSDPAFGLLIGGCEGGVVDCSNATRTYQDLSRIDFYSGNLSSLSPPPHGWYQHTASIVPSGELVVLGGVRTDTKYLESLGILQIYNGSNDTWSDKMISGPIPTPRRDHAAVVYRDSIIITGGASFDLSTRYSDTLMLNTTTWTWETLALDKALIPRRGHTAQMISPTEMLLSFGDFGPGTPSTQETMTIINLETRTVLSHAEGIFPVKVLDPNHKKHLGPGEIALIIVFSVVGLVGIALLTWWWARREVRPEVQYSTSSYHHRPDTPDAPPSSIPDDQAEWTVVTGNRSLRPPGSSFPRRLWLSVSSSFGHPRSPKRPDMKEREAKGVFNAPTITVPHPQDHLGGDPPSPASSSSTAIAYHEERVPPPSEEGPKRLPVHIEPGQSKNSFYEYDDGPITLNPVEEDPYEDILRSRAFHSYLTLSESRDDDHQVYQERQEDRV
ncbi:MAG: hypothetical protein DHS80DRAFT_22037 [Piptocephalis tieghemiana]|nr:MAG: hypothetical protein DHS80DRAFT_22037 [Piptocephalis tieghemiana]